MTPRFEALVDLFPDNTDEYEPKNHGGDNNRRKHLPKKRAAVLRSTSEDACRLCSCQLRKHISAPAGRPDPVASDLAAEPGDDHLYRVGIDLGITVIDALYKFPAIDGNFLTQDQAGKHPPFERSQFQGQAFELEGAELRVKHQRSTNDP